MVEIKIISRNRRAYHEYEIVEKVEAGIVLAGTEVKAVRNGKVNLGEGWVGISDQGEAILKQIHISHYSHGNIYNHLEVRERKLLLKKREIRKLAENVDRKGYSLVPLKMYIKGQMIKVQIGLGKGKKDHDKRQASKERDAKKEIDRAMKNSRF